MVQQIQLTEPAVGNHERGNRITETAEPGGFAALLTGQAPAATHLPDAEISVDEVQTANQRALSNQRWTQDDLREADEQLDRRRRYLNGGQRVRDSSAGEVQRGELGLGELAPYVRRSAAEIALSAPVSPDTTVSPATPISTTPVPLPATGDATGELVAGQLPPPEPRAITNIQPATDPSGSSNISHKSAGSQQPSFTPATANPPAQPVLAITNIPGSSPAPAPAGTSVMTGTASNNSPTAGVSTARSEAAPAFKPVIAARLLQKHSPTVMQQVVEVLRLQQGLKSGSIKLQLRPPELGELIIDVRVQEGRVQLRMESSNPAVRELLSQHAAQLTQLLAEQGLKVEQVEIEPRVNLPSWWGGELGGYSGGAQHQGREDDQPERLADEDMISEETETIQIIAKTPGKRR
ncbi:MAG: hypothetical protein HJJLKODD_01830 [Phycisphaerae bacterium]|nr:hypothetical protein [Phycisphaerae bacterium]